MIAIAALVLTALRATPAVLYAGGQSIGVFGRECLPTRRDVLYLPGSQNRASPLARGACFRARPLGLALTSGHIQARYIRYQVGALLSMGSEGFCSLGELE